MKQTTKQTAQLSPLRYSPAESMSLDLPPGTIVTAVGLILPDGLSFDVWAKLGEQLLFLGRGATWWMGDWLFYGEHRGGYGEMYSQVLQDKFGLEYNTLAIVTLVAKKVEFLRRRKNLSWSHHREVVKFEPEVQDAWLNLAEQDSWTRQRLRAEIKQHELEEAQARIAAQTSNGPPPVIVQADWETWLAAQPACDLLLTDPPYSTDIKEIAAFAQAWLPPALAKVKATGRAYVCIGAYPHELAAYLAVKPDFLTLANVLVWAYQNTLGPSPKLDYKLNWQAILYYRGPQAAALDCPLMTEQFAAQTINAPDGRIGDRYHEWQKPSELAERLIRHSTKPGDLVLDCFAGTGTFALAAAKLGRRVLACEPAREMLDIAERRGCQIAG